MESPVYSSGMPFLGVSLKSGFPLAYSTPLVIWEPTDFHGWDGSTRMNNPFVIRVYSWFQGKMHPTIWTDPFFRCLSYPEQAGSYVGRRRSVTWPTQVSQLTDPGRSLDRPRCDHRGHPYQRGLPHSTPRMQTLGLLFAPNPWKCGGLSLYLR